MQHHPGNAPGTAEKQSAVNGRETLYHKLKLNTNNSASTAKDKDCEDSSAKHRSCLSEQFSTLLNPTPQRRYPKTPLSVHIPSAKDSVDHQSPCPPQLSANVFGFQQSVPSTKVATPVNASVSLRTSRTRSVMEPIITHGHVQAISLGTSPLPFSPHSPGWFHNIPQGIDAFRTGTMRRRSLVYPLPTRSSTMGSNQKHTKLVQRTSFQGTILPPQFHSALHSAFKPRIRGKVRRASLVSIHLPEYKCQQCGRMFQTPSNLRRHERLHSGKKPFQCQHCGRSFAAKYNKDRHERDLHSSTAEQV